MSLRTRRSAERRSRYLLLVQVGLAASLGVLVLAFSIALRAEAVPTVAAPPPEADPMVHVAPTTHRTDAPRPPVVEAPPVIGADDLPMPDVAIDVDFAPDVPALPAGPPAVPDRPVAPEPEARETFVAVEDQPVLVGGLEALQQRLRYPEHARRAGIQGLVVVQFVVDEQGQVSEPECLRDPGGGLCAAAIAAVRGSTFEPGRQRGRAVRVRMALPVQFRLR